MIIKSSEWLRGTGRDPRYYSDMLFNGECYCVQGLYCKELGMANDVMEFEFWVCNIPQVHSHDIAQKIEWLGVMFKSDDADMIETINDDTTTTDAEKIALLKPIFAAHGEEIEYREDL